MTGGHLPWGVAWTALCILLGIMIGWPIGHSRGRRRAAEDARDDADAAVVAGWKDEDPRLAPVQPAGLPGIATLGIPPTAGSAPPWPAAPPDPPRPGPGKHRHPSGPPKHTALPAAGYLPAEPSPWARTITVPAPVQRPPWETPEPQTEVLEPTAVLPPPDPRTDTAWTREMAADMDRWIAEHITATDSTLKEITGGAI